MRKPPLFFTLRGFEVDLSTERARPEQSTETSCITEEIQFERVPEVYGKSSELGARFFRQDDRGQSSSRGCLEFFGDAAHWKNVTLK